MKPPSFDLPPLKRPPRYGAYVWWPQKGFDWIHPDDLETALTVIPSPRIFKNVELEKGFSEISYGDIKIRVLPTLWLEIEHEGYEIGDQVEVKSRMGKDRPFVGTITEILWDTHLRTIEYHLFSAGRQIPKPFSFDQIQPAHKLDQAMDVRQMELAARSRLR